MPEDELSGPRCGKCGRGNHLVGIEIEGMYDGVLVWWCNSRDCGAYTAANFGDNKARQKLADIFAREYNTARDRHQR